MEHDVTIFCVLLENVGMMYELIVVCWLRASFVLLAILCTVHVLGDAGQGLERRKG